MTLTFMTLYRMSLLDKDDLNQNDLDLAMTLTSDA